MSARTSDVDRALRAAGSVTDADVLCLPQDAIAGLAAETVETIAWTFDDAARDSAAAREPIVTRGRRRIALAAVLALTAAGGAALAVVAGSDQPVPLLGQQPVPISVADATERAAGAACLSQLKPRESVSVHTRDGRSQSTPIGCVTVVPPSPSS